jgi:hypothetical protein
MNYIERLKVAETESIKLALCPKLDFKTLIPDEKLSQLNAFCSEDLINLLLGQFGPGDWSQQCLNVAPQTFAILQHYNIPCELVYGEVIIAGVKQFKTTITGLKKELNVGESDTGMAIHVWINIGNNYIIDPTISAWCKKHHDSNCPQNVIFNGNDVLMREQGIEYVPMLVGTKFLDITCGIPLEYKSREQSV